MSGWGMGWFGGGGAATASKKKDAPKNAILQLRGTLEMLNKRERHLQNQIDDQDAQARKYVATNKPAAKTALRRKKTLEGHMEQTQAQMMTIEREIGSIETANINKETLDAMVNASKAMKQIHGGLTVDKVDDTMEKLREEHAIADEISEALTNGATANNLADEDELEDELNDLQQQELDNKVLDAGTMPVSDTVSALPNAGSRTLPNRTPVRRQQQEEEDDEEAELKKLQAEMAI